jgi:hypothetical protein
MRCGGHGRGKSGPYTRAMNCDDQFNWVVSPQSVHRLETLRDEPASGASRRSHEHFSGRLSSIGIWVVTITQEFLDGICCFTEHHFISLVTFDAIYP